ncbi:MAG: FecR domain-containing protein, partial [Rubrivivax sp.]|nr:FecR domain-containing protein [Rubrivivax sp.]
MSPRRHTHRSPGRLLRALSAFMLALTLLPALAAEADETWDYRIEPGDTLIGVARELLAEPQRWRDLQRLNRVGNPRRLPIGGTLRIPLAWLHTEASVASVVMSAGPVSLLRGSAAARSVAVGDSLQSADRLQTGEDASTMIELADGTRVLMAPKSRLTLHQLLQYRGSGGRASVLQLHEGSAETQVRPDAPRPRFELRTPVLTLGVRGT